MSYLWYNVSNLSNKSANLPDDDIYKLFAYWAINTINSQIFSTKVQKSVNRVKSAINVTTTSSLHKRTSIADWHSPTLFSAPFPGAWMQIEEDGVTLYYRSRRAPYKHISLEKLRNLKKSKNTK